MADRAHALISLEPRHAEAILGTMKRVEFRRRSMNVPVGTTIWFYVKVPVGQVIGCAQVQGSHLLAPTTLWKRYGAVSGLTRTEFFDYFSGVAKGCAIVLERPWRLSAGVPLRELRALVDGFQPPQFFQHLAHGGSLLTAFLGDVPPVVATGGGRGHVTRPILPRQRELACQAASMQPSVSTGP